MTERECLTFYCCVCLCVRCESRELWCDLPGCHLLFRSIAAFDDHYLAAHTYRCEVCGLKLPNNRLLEMHIAERHDELFRCMAKTKRMVNHTRNHSSFESERTTGG